MITGATARRQQATARLLLAIGLVAVVIIWVRLFLRPSGDLLNHQEFGRRFLAGTFLYDGGLNYPYLPTWAMAHAPLAVIPSWLVSALVFPIGLASLLALLWMLDRLSRQCVAARRPQDTARGGGSGGAQLALRHPRSGRWR